MNTTQEVANEVNQRGLAVAIGKIVMLPLTITLERCAKLIAACAIYEWQRGKNDKGQSFYTAVVTVNIMWSKIVKHPEWGFKTEDEITEEGKANG